MDEATVVSEALMKFAKESRRAGRQSSKDYQRRFVRILRDMGCTLATQAARLDSNAIGRIPFRPGRQDKKQMQAPVRLFIPCEVEMAPMVGPVEILNTMVLAEKNGGFYEGDERLEAVCLAACLTVAGLAKEPLVLISSDVPQIARRDQTLYQFLILCWHLVHSGNIVQGLRRRFPSGVTRITKALVPSLIRAAYRVKASPPFESSQEVIPVYQQTTDMLEAEFRNRKIRVAAFLNQVEELVRYLWNNADGSSLLPLLVDDAVVMQMQYGSIMRETLPAIMTTVLIFRDLVSTTKALNLDQRQYPTFGTMSQMDNAEAKEATRNLIYAAISSGEDPMPTTSEQEQSTLLSDYVEGVQRDRGVAGCIISARIAIIEAELDLYMALPQADAALRQQLQVDEDLQPAVEMDISQTTLAPRERKTRADVQVGNLLRSRLETAAATRQATERLKDFRKTLLLNVRQQMDALMKQVREMSTGATVVDNVAMHAGVVLQLAPTFAHFLAMAVALGFYGEQQAILQYFPFSGPISAEQQAADNDYGLMGDLHAGVLKGAVSWLSPLIHLADGGGDRRLVDRIRRNVTEFLDSVLTRANVLQHMHLLERPLRASTPTEEVPPALVRAQDIHSLMLAKRTLRVVLRAFVSSITNELTPRELYLSGAVEYLTDVGGFLDSSIAAAARDQRLRYSVATSFGLGDLEEHEGTKMRRAAFNRWTDVIGKFLNKIAADSGGRITQDMVHTAMLRLCSMAGGDRTVDMLRQLYAAVGALDVLRGQPDPVSRAVLAAHAWSLQRQGEKMQRFVDHVSGDYPGGGGFTAYGTTTLSDIERVPPSTASVVEPEEASSESDSEEHSLPLPVRQKTGAAPLPSGGGGRIASYPTKDDVVLADLLSTMLVLVADGHLDPAWVTSVAGSGIVDMLEGSDALHPAKLDPASADKLVDSVVADFAGLLKTAVDAQGQPPQAGGGVSEAEPVPPPPAKLVRYNKLAVLVHLLPESEQLLPDRNAGPWSACEVKDGRGSDERLTSSLLIIGGLRVPTVAPQAKDKEGARRANEEQVRAAFVAMVQGALYLPTFGAGIVLSDPDINITLVPYVEPSLANMEDVKRFLSSGDEPLLPSISSHRGDPVVVHIAQAPEFIPVMRSRADSAEVIAVLYKSDALREYVSAAAYEMTTDRSGRIQSGDFLQLASQALYLFTIRRSSSRLDDFVVRGVSRASTDTTSALVDHSQLLIIYDLPVFWALQVVRDVRLHARYKSMAFIIAYSSKQKFVEAVVTHRCVRMEVQANLLQTAAAAAVVEVVIFPDALVELLGVPTH